MFAEAGSGKNRLLMSKESDEEQRRCQSALSSASDTSSEFATTVKKLAEHVASVSMGSEMDVPEQKKSKPGAWLSKSQRTAIENSWKRAIKVVLIIFKIKISRISQTKA